MLRQGALALPVVFAIVLAGCFHGGGNGGGGNGGGGTVASTAFTSAPASGVAGETIVVCWRVEGSGQIGHAAIHTDTASRAGQSFTAYTGTTFYPANASAPTAVTLPADLCTGVRLPSAVPAGGKLYLRAHAMDPAKPPGALSPAEKAVTVLAGGADVATSITFVSYPQKAAANSTAIVCWRVEGQGNVTRTAVLWDVASRNQSGVTSQAYVKDPVYPNNMTPTDSTRYAIPGTFCGGLPLPVDEPRVYLRAHVLDAGGAPGKLSTKEATIDVVGAATSISIVDGSVPAFAPKGSNVTVCWRVLGEGIVPETSIRTDNASHPDAATADAYTGSTFYPNNATLAAQGYTIPATFCTNVRMPADSGLFYLRAHVVDVAGPPGRLSGEKQILVV